MGVVLIILNRLRQMRNNYHNPSQSEDSVTKISRSKSRNQMTIANKIKEKVLPLTCRRADGTSDSTSNRSLSTTFRTSPTSSVPQTTRRPQEQAPHPQQEVPLSPPRNDRNDLSKAKRVHEASLDKSTPPSMQTRWATSPISVERSSGRSRR